MNAILSNLEETRSAVLAEFQATPESNTRKRNALQSLLKSIDRHWRTVYNLEVK